MSSDITDLINLHWHSTGERKGTGLDKPLLTFDSRKKQKEEKLERVYETNPKSWSALMLVSIASSKVFTADLEVYPSWRWWSWLCTLPRCNIISAIKVSSLLADTLASSKAVPRTDALVNQALLTPSFIGLWRTMTSSTVLTSMIWLMLSNTIMGLFYNLSILYRLKNLSNRAMSRWGFNFIICCYFWSLVI